MQRTTPLWLHKEHSATKAVVAKKWKQICSALLSLAQLRLSGGQNTTLKWSILVLWLVNQSRHFRAVAICFKEGQEVLYIVSGPCLWKMIPKISCCLCDGFVGARDSPKEFWKLPFLVVVVWGFVYPSPWTSKMSTKTHTDKLATDERNHNQKPQEIKDQRGRGTRL